MPAVFIQEVLSILAKAQVDVAHYGLTGLVAGPSPDFLGCAGTHRQPLTAVTGDRPREELAMTSSPVKIHTPVKIH
jgi:hypothetical protein